MLHIDMRGIFELMLIETDNQFHCDFCDKVFYDSDGDIGMLEEAGYLRRLNDRYEGEVFDECRDCRIKLEEMAYGE